MHKITTLVSYPKSREEDLETRTCKRVQLKISEVQLDTIEFQSTETNINSKFSVGEVRGGLSI